MYRADRLPTRVNKACDRCRAQKKRVSCIEVWKRVEPLIQVPRSATASARADIAYTRGRDVRRTRHRSQRQLSRSEDLKRNTANLSTSGNRDNGDMPTDLLPPSPVSSKPCQVVHQCGNGRAGQVIVSTSQCLRTPIQRERCGTLLLHGVGVTIAHLPPFEINQVERIRVCQVSWMLIRPWPSLERFKSTRPRKARRQRLTRARSLNRTDRHRSRSELPSRFRVEEVAIRTVPTARTVCPLR
jgi:hypothetical protein